MDEQRGRVSGREKGGRGRFKGEGERSGCVLRVCEGHFERKRELEEGISLDIADLVFFCCPVCITGV